MKKEAKVKLLKEMDKYIRENINDEELFCEVWLLYMPDEASKDDYEFIAENEANYNECLEVFTRICIEDAKDK